MKYFRKINEFIHESRLDHLYVKFGIPEIIKEEVDKVVDYRLSNVRGEVKSQRDRICLWVAKTLTEYVKKDMVGKLTPEEINFAFDYAYKLTHLTRKTKSLDDKKFSLKAQEIYVRTKYHIMAIREIIEDKLKSYNGILDWVVSPLRDIEERIDWNNATYDQLDQKQKDWHESIKHLAGGSIENETGTIIKKYDDGFYWIDLETNTCEDEGEAMGHCGTTDGDTLWSLRDSKKEPHVTIAIKLGEDGDGYLQNDSPKTVFQIKGKGNDKPIEKYHKYIADLYLDPKVNIQSFEPEYDAEGDFTIFDLLDKDIIKRIIKEKPGLVYVDPYTYVNPFHGYDPKDIKEILKNFQKEKYLQRPIFLLLMFVYGVISEKKFNAYIQFTHLVVCEGNEKGKVIRFPSDGRRITDDMMMCKACESQSEAELDLEDEILINSEAFYPGDEGGIFNKKTGEPFQGKEYVDNNFTYKILVVSDFVKQDFADGNIQDAVELAIHLMEE